jgi:hypothetical protein
MTNASQKVLSLLAIGGLASASAAQAQQVVKPANSSTAQTPVLVESTSDLTTGGHMVPP